MAHCRVIDCSWDESTKVASVTLSSKWGMFTEYAWPHDEDMDVANKWIGWHIAEYKCRIALQQARMNAMRERYYGLLSYEEQLWHSCAYSDALRYAKKDWNDARDKYKNLKHNFQAFCKDQIESRRKFLEDLEKKNMQIIWVSMIIFGIHFFVDN